MLGPYLDFAMVKAHGNDKAGDMDSLPNDGNGI